MLTTAVSLNADFRVVIGALNGSEQRAQDQNLGFSAINGRIAFNHNSVASMHGQTRYGLMSQIGGPPTGLGLILNETFIRRCVSVR